MELKEAITSAWANLQEEYLGQLVAPMKLRYIKIIDKKGSVLTLRDIQTKDKNNNNFEDLGAKNADQGSQQKTKRIHQELFQKT